MNTTMVEWMTEDQVQCYELLIELFRGEHHIDKVKKFGRGICVNTSQNLFATYDFNGLTRLVILAHDKMIRAEILPSGPNMLKISLFKRHEREGMMFERHPTIENAIETIRGEK